jgi:peptide/nickel transport system substrate-binding protein
MNVSAADIDNRLLAGDIGVDSAGSGVQPAAQARILSSPTLKANADDPVNGFARFAYLVTTVAPMNNVHCRQAVEYAANKVTAQTGYGGPFTGGAIASTVDVPTIVGYQSFDLYEALTKPTGDIAKAKEQLALCGQPNGFSTNLAYRADRPKETAAATALQASLALAGIKVTLKGFPAGTYYTNFAGAPAYVHSHQLGIAMGGWGADWPTGFGFLDSLVDGKTITATGNSNIEELNDPVVNNLFTKSSTLSGDARTAIWAQIDHQVMADAGILPLVYSKALLYRPPSDTNVYVQAYYGFYNYAVMGAK